MITVYAAGALIVLVMLGAGGLMTDVGDWYRALKKPVWNPPNWLFGPAWTLILGLACWSWVNAWIHASQDGTRLRLALLVAANALLHIFWSPLFFKLKRPDFSLMEIPFLWLSILALLIDVAQISLLSAWLLAPYLMWVTYATALNYAIVRMNAPFR